MGQNEDYSLGDSTSDSSEKLLQRGREKDQYIRDFGEGGIHEAKHIFSQKVSTSLMKFLLVMKDFSTFIDMRRYKNWALKISS